MNRLSAHFKRHHFKHSRFCRAGELHVHFPGNAVLSLAGEVSDQERNVFEISATGFLKNNSGNRLFASMGEPPKCSNCNHQSQWFK